MSSPAVRLGIVGLGRMGQNHVRVLSLLKRADIRFVYDTNPEIASNVAAIADVPVATDLAEALADVDAVVIATPTVTHSDCVHELAPYVRNLFVEKPLADTSARAKQVAELAARDGLNIQVGFIERFNPAVQQLRSVLERSSAVVSVDFTRTNKISERITDVDVVTDLMIHDIDLALYLNGPVKMTSAHGVTTGEMIEFASAVLVHNNGRYSRIVASRITEKKTRLIQATCRDMFVDCDLLRKEIAISRQSVVAQPQGEPYTIRAVEETLEVPPQEALILELQAFLESCQSGPRTTTPGVNAGVEALHICEQIQASIRASCTDTIKPSRSPRRYA